MSIFFVESFKEHTEKETKAIMDRIMFLVMASRLLRSEKQSKDKISK